MMRNLPTIKEVNIAVALGQMFKYRIAADKEAVYDVQPAEESLRPLVEAIDDTYRVKTIYNCRGRLDPVINGYDVDEASAIVGFLLRDGADRAGVEAFFIKMTMAFNNTETSVFMKFWKNLSVESQDFYYLELTHCGCEELLDLRIGEVNAAIHIVAEMIIAASGTFEKGKG